MPAENDIHHPAKAEQAVRDTTGTPDAEGRPERSDRPERSERSAKLAAALAWGARGSRRFPLFTKDTARPEGGGRAASGDLPAPARQWPILIVLSSVALGLLLTALDVFRFGTLLIGLALIAGAVMRWMLPSVGMLAVRSRFTDIVTYGVLGLVIFLLSMMAQPDPWLEIPFLKDTLHFTLSQ
ncbi:DUF3017 domain-containing protein [Streptomyces sp. NPDC046805]|uniref:DUF3017 domain-containing protein n=1 Tax=Streptomyces sp. NPDC046805 TaxID=3155134 RepID=UPI003408C6D7